MEPTPNLYPGDNRATLRRLIDEGVRVHSVVTDPPYGLVSIQKRFAKQNSKAASSANNDGSFNRLSKGFMGKAWDGTGIERDPEFWKLIYDILLPGGYCFAFSGSRTGHWQACAMEMAGFIMHPMHGWVFGTGFPKAHNASKAIDKMLGAAGEKGAVRGASGSKRNAMQGDFTGGEYHDYISGSNEAAQWEGWAYGTQTQKPALEPIYLAQKPFAEKNGAANLLKHGVGAVNIDGCRVSHVTIEGGNLALNPHLREAINGGNGGHIFPTETERRVVTPNAMGRHPSNLILDGSPEVVSMFPDSKGQQGRSTDSSRSQKNTYGAVTDNGKVYEPRSDSGSAARFFHQFQPDADPLFYSAKASKKDRAGSQHPTVKPVALMQYLIRHITPPGGTVLDPFAGSGTTGVAAQNEGFFCILMEAEDEYVDFLTERFGTDSVITSEPDAEEEFDLHELLTCQPAARGAFENLETLLV